MNQLLGTDISFYQDDNNTPQGIDFQAMAKTTSFVIIRSGQNNWIDSDFKVNWRNAKQAGIPRGSYWFYDSRADPKKQAQLWVDILGDDLGELPLWCDFEDRYGGIFGTWQHWYDFIEIIKQLTNGKQIGIYTGYYYWIEFTINKFIPNKSLEYFVQYPLWIAAYNNTAPLIPKPWTEWSLWQFTDKGNGKLYGVESRNIDLNYASDYFAKQYNLSNLNQQEEEQENNEMTIYQMKPMFSGTRLHDHNTFATVITSYGSNHTVSGNQLWEASADGVEVKKGDKWLYVTHVNGNEILEKGWMAYIHKGQFICDDFKIIGDVPLPEPEPVPQINADINIVIEEGIITSVMVNGEQWKK